MKTIKFYDLKDKLTHIEFDGDKTDLRLHSQESYRWSRENEEDYKAVEKQLNEFEVEGNGWIVYVWCDISGYDYWMKRQEEYNYIQITVSFESEDVLISEINNIEDALIQAENFAEGIEASNDIELPFY